MTKALLVIGTLLLIAYAITEALEVEYEIESELMGEDLC